MAKLTERDLKDAEARGARRVREVFDRMFASGDWEGQVSLGFAATFDQECGEEGLFSGSDELNRLHSELARLIAFYKFQQKRWNATTPEEMRTWDEDDRDPVNVACHIYGHVAQEIKDVVEGEKALGVWQPE